jgi:DNA adenine methylase
MRSKVEFVARNLQNRAGVRLLMACLLAKAHKLEIDIRKPYTEIGGNDSYSGRTYDEQYISAFISEHGLPCNSTTAFLTPALRNRNIVLTPDMNLVGRPPRLYQSVLELLTDVHAGRVAAEDLLAETVRSLLVLRDQQRLRMETLLSQLEARDDTLLLSAENIITLIQQHLASPRSSRLLVLIVAAAYTAASANLGERVLPLKSHNAADRQTGALGDVEITLVADNNVITSYEMKDKRVTRTDLDIALAKILHFHQQQSRRIDNYIFVTTEAVTVEVQEYAASLYQKTGGVEFVVLDCVAFLRHFLHLFHRLRMQFLDAYQKLVLQEPDSSVSQPLKELFLTLRQAAESQISEEM